MSTREIQVTHNTEARQFEATVNGKLCECAYRLDGRTMVMLHTGVPRPLQGQGIAAALVADALAWAEREGYSVRPLCSYVRTYMRRHPETQSLLAAAS